MRTIQEIFNVVIGAGHYHQHGRMCFAINDAHDYELITAEERDLAEEEDYLSDRVHADLVDALRSAGFAFRFEDRLAIYQKWADRPLP